MNANKEIAKRIAKEEKEIALYGQKITELEKEIAVCRGSIQALKGVLKLLPKDDENEEDTFQLRHGSVMHKTSLALKESGIPLHITDILHVIGMENTIKNRNSISTSLANYTKRGVIFTRPGPNIYGLKEFNQHNVVSDTNLPGDFVEPKNKD